MYILTLWTACLFPIFQSGLPVLSCIRKVTDLTLDVHLMIDRPVRYAERFCQAGADIVTVHVEADTQENTLEALRIIRACGKKPAICVKPKTPAEAVLPFIELVDLILVMTDRAGLRRPELHGRHDAQGAGHPCVYR